MTAPQPPQPPGPPGPARDGGPAPGGVLAPGGVPARDSAPAAAGGLASRFARWLPWDGRPRARDVCCLLAIAVSAGYALVTIPLTPALIASHPVLLELLTGSTSSIVAAGAFADVDSKLQLALVVAAALPGLMRFDWVFWWAGRLWGHQVVEKLSRRSPRAAALASAIETRGRWFAGPLVALAAFLPDGISTAIYAAAGWTGLPLIPFLLFDALGSAAFTTLAALGGYLLGSEGVMLASLISRYAIVTVCVLVAAMIAPHLWHSWRDRRARKPPASETASLNLPID